MPLRDHFRPPLDDLTSWDGFHGLWPSVIAQALSKRLSDRYVAAPHVHLGSEIEIDVGTYERDEEGLSHGGRQEENGGIATAVWTPPAPTLTIAAELPDPDEYEVRIYDAKRSRRLVAAIEIVSPSNKDRPENRRPFVAKCAALLQERVCVTIVDLVTTRSANLYADLLEFLGQADPTLAADPSPLNAVTCRWNWKGSSWFLETWAHPLTLGQPLPTLPLWIAEDLAVPLELETWYEETCRALRIP